MAKHKVGGAVRLVPAGSRVRPGLRRSLAWLMRTGKLPALLVAALAGWGLYDAWISPRYKVQEVEAIGTQALSRDDVRALAAVDGQPIWFVDVYEVAERVRQSPYVEHAEAHLVLPDRVEVTVAERKPEVRWTHDGVVFAVTWDGLIVDRERPPEPAAPITTTDALPVGPPVTDTTGLVPKGAEAPPAAEPAPEPFVSTVTVVDTTPNRPLAVGDHVDPDALELARRVSLRAPTELPVPITRIEWDAGLGVSLIVGEGRQVVLGKSNDLDRKMATLRYLLADNTPFSFLDLRPSTPYYR